MDIDNAELRLAIDPPSAGYALVRDDKNYDAAKRLPLLNHPREGGDPDGNIGNSWVSALVNFKAKQLAENEGIERG